MPTDIKEDWPNGNRCECPLLKKQLKTESCRIAKLSFCNSFVEVNLTKLGIEAILTAYNKTMYLSTVIYVIDVKGQGLSNITVTAYMVGKTINQL